MARVRPQAKALRFFLMIVSPLWVEKKVSAIIEKTLRLRGGESESVHSAHVERHIFAWSGSSYSSYRKHTYRRFRSMFCSVLKNKK